MNIICVVINHRQAEYITKNATGLSEYKTTEPRTRNTKLRTIQLIQQKLLTDYIIN